jgi:amidase
MDQHAFGSATWLAREIRDRRLGCLEVLNFYLARAERHNPALNAIIAWQIGAARQRARDADMALAKGEVWGPLHGIPMTVKESFNVAGLPTTFGNPLWKDNIATSNAVLVDRLLRAGAIIFGKTNVPFLLMDSQSHNDIYGTTNNPWDLARGPGGSSGGEAAVLATGLSALGAGSDIAGSLRNPAHYCGVYGHKPSWGLIPSRGHALAATVTPTDISVVGPMARHAEDLALALNVLAGPEILQQAAWRTELPPPRGRRLADFKCTAFADLHLLYDLAGSGIPGGIRMALSLTALSVSNVA